MTERWEPFQPTRVRAMWQVARREGEVWYSASLIRGIDAVFGWTRIGCTIRTQVYRAHGFDIGANSAIQHGFRFHSMSAPIRVGAETFINRNVLIDSAAAVTIDDRCAIGPGVQFLTSRHQGEPHPHHHRPLIDPLPITIGDDVWIGASAVVLPGVTVGNGATVGANATVTRDVPPGATVVGSPARSVTTPTPAHLAN
jgi:maltose O-acetyltransferase